MNVNRTIWVVSAAVAASAAVLVAQAQTPAKANVVRVA